MYNAHLQIQVGTTARTRSEDAVRLVRRPFFCFWLFDILPLRFSRRFSNWARRSSFLSAAVCYRACYSYKCSNLLSRFEDPRSIWSAYSPVFWDAVIATVSLPSFSCSSGIKLFFNDSFVTSFTLLSSWSPCFLNWFLKSFGTLNVLQRISWGLVFSVRPLWSWM